MPPVIVAIASYGAAAWAGATAVAAGWGAFAVAAVKFGVAFVVTAIGNKLLGGRPDVPSSERRETIRSAAANRRVGFGVVRTGGVLVHAMTTGDENKFMHMIIALQHGEVDLIQTRFFLNNKASDDSSFAGKVYAEFFSGTESQAACASMISADPLGWTANHRLRGIAYVYLRLEYDQTAFPSGLPTASFIVRASKMYDPRSPGSPPAWSNNTALCMLHYLRAPWGMNAPDSLIDMASFITAANICDEVVDSIDPALAGLKRYTCNGMIDLGAAPTSIIESMKTSFAGQQVFSNGKYRLYAGAYNAPVAQINPHMLREDPIVRMSPSRSELFNAVRGSYVEPRQDWQEVDYWSQVNAAAAIEDGADIVQPMSFPFTTNGATAQRLAKLALARARGGVSMELRLNWSGMQLQLWDVVQLQLPGPSALQATYRIVGFTLAVSGGVDVTLQAEDPSYYAWDPFTDETLVPALNGSATPINSSLVISAGEAYPITQSPTPRLTVAWHMAAFTNTAALSLINTKVITGFYVQWRKSGTAGYSAVRDTQFVKTLDASGRFSCTTTAIEGNTSYYARVRAAFAGGGGGPWVEVLLQPYQVSADGIIFNLEDQSVFRTTAGPNGNPTVGGKIQLVFRSTGELQVYRSPLYLEGTVRVNGSSTSETLPLQWHAGANAIPAGSAEKYSVRATLVGVIKGTYAKFGYLNVDMSFGADNRTGWFGLNAATIIFGVSFEQAIDGYAQLPLFLEIKNNATGQIIDSAYCWLRLDVA